MMTGRFLGHDRLDLYPLSMECVARALERSNAGLHRH